MLKSRHVFIAYGKDVAEQAFEINRILVSLSVKTWIDFEQLTSTQESSIEERTIALRSARAVILISGQEKIEDCIAGFEIEEIKRQIEFIKNRRNFLTFIKLHEAMIFSDWETKETQSVYLRPGIWNNMDVVGETMKQNWADDFKILEAIFRMADNQDPYAKIPNLYESEGGDLLPQSEGALFSHDELDIHIEEGTGKVYFFHGKALDVSIDYLEYHRAQCRVAVVLYDGTRFDLGVRIHWQIRHHLSREAEVQIVRTHEGKSLSGIKVPLLKAVPKLAVNDGEFTQVLDRKTSEKKFARFQKWIEQYK